MSEWKTYKLGDICTKIGSGATPSGGKEAYKGGDYNLVRSQNVLDFSFSCEGLAQINEEQATKLNNVELQANDVLLNITGDSVARTCLVPTYVLPARVNQHVAIVRANKDILDCYYLLYFIQSQKTNLLSLASGGATRNALTKSMIENYEISLPSLSEQKRISSILKSLDDKIENNRKINENLEQQAQALFKSWFIDFEPFKDGKFIDSELGPIPQGWRVGRLEEICEIVGGGTPSKSRLDYYSERAIAWLTPKDLSNHPTKFTSRGENDITQIGYENSSAKLMPKGSVLFSSRAPIGYITIAENDICTNQGFKSAVPGIAGTSFLYCFLKHSVPEIESKATGTTFKEASGSLMKSLPVIIPTDGIFHEFEKLLAPIFYAQQVKESETKYLAKLRDTLLPKLMSGEIEV